MSVCLYRNGIFVNSCCSYSAVHVFFYFVRICESRGPKKVGRKFVYHGRSRRGVTEVTEENTIGTTAQTRKSFGSTKYQLH
jgi:hypothetical protein